MARHGAAAVRTNVVPPRNHSALAALQYGAQQNIPMLATLLEPCTKTVELAELHAIGFFVSAAAPP